MAVNAADSIRETTTVEGTGPATLGGSTVLARAFADVATYATLPVADIPYRIDAIDGAALAAGQCEQGIGTLLVDGTFQRTSPTWSRSNDVVSAGACSFAAGTKHLYVAASFDSVQTVSADALAGHIATADPHAQYQRETERGAANGYAALDASTQVPLAQLPTGTTSATVALGDAPAAAVATHAALTSTAHGITTAGAALTTAASAAAQRTALALGTAAQSASTDFAPAAHVAATTGAHGMTAFGASLVDDADATAARSTLGLGTAATRNVGTAAGTVAAGDDTRLSTFTSSTAGLVPASGGGTANFLRADGTFAPPPGGGGGSTVEKVTVVVDFGTTFTDRADTVVTGLSWVTGAHVLTPVLRPSAGVDADEIRLLEMSALITNVVDGVGFTLVATTTPEARGPYTFLVTGV